MNESNISGFNGLRCDPLTARYHPGNGYRAYSPVLMRFTCPDSLSPFGAGGVNTYTYCNDEPLNHADPTGHAPSIGTLFGLVVGLIGGVILGVFTAGLSLPATVAAEAAFSLSVQGISMALDHQDPTKISAGSWAILAAGVFLSAAGGTAAGRIFSRVKGSASRPFGGLMVEGDEAMTRAARATAGTRNETLRLSTRGSRLISRYETEAYEVARRDLNLPQRTRYGTQRIPNLGRHRRLVQSHPIIPQYSAQLRNLAPLPDELETELNGLYDRLNLNPATRQFSVPETRPQSGILPVNESDAALPSQSPPPRYAEADHYAISTYEKSVDDELLDYHYMTHL